MDGAARHNHLVQALDANTLPHVVVIGAGFGGLNAVKALAKAHLRITLIDQRNYHLFQPLLYQVATAALSPAQIATPIRKVLSRQRNVTVLMETVSDVDVPNKVVMAGARRIGFDYLIVATGARHGYFGHDDWEQFAPGLKTIGDAIAIRRRVLLAFERAEVEERAEERQKLLTFAVIGGGPTGVELAGAIAELARKSIVSDFTHIDSSSSRIVLVEAGPRILPSLPEELSQSARDQLMGLGVEVITGDGVVKCSAGSITLKSGTEILCRTIIWGAGVMASPAALWLKAEADRAGRVKTGADLTLPGHPDIFVIGDTVATADAAGKPVPGVAPAAKQMGVHVARAIVNRLEGKPMKAFVYRDYGNLATIGRKAAVADFGRFRLRGLVAWLCWSLIHVGFLVGFRSRFTVMLDWAWSYVTHNRGARLITGSEM